ncbi:MAG: M50 family metallopeptidase [Novosphingobium sp.]
MPSEPEPKTQKGQSFARGIVTWLKALTGWILGLALLLWAGILSIESFDAVQMPLVGVILFVILLPFSTLVHEFGHAFGAHLVRWKVIVISVRWFAYQAHNRQFIFSRRAKMGDVGGWVLAVPTEIRSNTFGRRAIMIIGGPTASIVQGLICLWLGAWFLPYHVAGEPNYALAVSAFGVMGLSCFVLTAIPSQSKISNRKNDGAKLWSLWRSPDRGARDFPSNAISSLLSFNMRLRDLPYCLVEAWEEQACNEPEAEKAVRAFRIARLLDGQSVVPQIVRLEIDRYRSEFGGSNWLNACDAYLTAVYERDVQRARKVISQLEAPATTPQLECAAKAALAALTGNKKESADFLRQMDRFVAAASPFRNPTCSDIRKQIEALVP